MAFSGLIAEEAEVITRECDLKIKIAPEFIEERKPSERETDRRQHRLYLTHYIVAHGNVKVFSVSVGDLGVRFLIECRNDLRNLIDFKRTSLLS